jgi:integrase/recombinase XerD
MLFDSAGNRKYLVASEWGAFLNQADTAEPETRAFCHALVRTGGRLTEVRLLTARGFDLPSDTLTLRCLKRRAQNVFRQLPLDPALFEIVQATFDIIGRRADLARIDEPLWPWCRTTAWSRVRRVARQAGVPDHLCMPRAMRHTFGIEGAHTQEIDLGTMQKWMGHVRIESTVIYTTPVGSEERHKWGRMFTQRPAWTPF